MRSTEEVACELPWISRALTPQRSGPDYRPTFLARLTCVPVTAQAEYPETLFAIP